MQSQEKTNIQLILSLVILILSSVFFYNIKDTYPGIIEQKDSTETNDDFFEGKNLTVVILLYFMIITSGLLVGRFFNYQIDNLHKIISLVILSLICVYYAVVRGRFSIIVSLIALASVSMGIIFKDLMGTKIFAILSCVCLGCSLASYFIIENNSDPFRITPGKPDDPEALGRKLNNTEKSIIISIIILSSLLVCIILLDYYNLIQRKKEIASPTKKKK